ncbi:hypothetical protein CO669_25660 [Bradyrhizobium sp. Y36]|uniref:hypothetical protein n=1 Tax=Bradyrhizobium sp. Y36 TaxID=2035447 RepID=UPI000BE83361|nr:hypothetical protein [Bradyrhizobium sp. Y36]PDT87248.1 hypothetical protein CO669_25660 [Bradyrhizobium sp. Y36]
MSKLKFSQRKAPKIVFLTFIFVAWTWIIGQYDFLFAVIGGVGLLAFYWKIGAFDWFLEP